jgi:hypothetical protein
MKKGIVIKSQLKKQAVKTDELNQKLLLKEVNEILSHGGNYFHNAAIINSSETAQIKRLKTESLFTLKDIKQTCLKFGLRFLPLSAFSATIPYPTKIKCDAFEIEFEKKYEFYILTETRNFKNKNGDSEHLVFAKIDENRYYLVDSWGKKISLRRLIENLPFRNEEFLLLFVFLTSLIITLITPNNLLSTLKNLPYFNYIRFAFLFYSFTLISSIAIFYVVSIRKYLNNQQWNSTTFF